MSRITFEEFASAARADGYDEILQREWAPGTVLEPHTHTFSVRAIVARGEMRLNVGDSSRQLGVDGSFELEGGVLHAERYGPQGCTLWVARRHVSGTRVR